jgi:hypothetical protein
MPVSSSNATAAGAKGGQVDIIYQGQTTGPFGNDPMVENKYTQQKMTKELKP